MTELRRELAMRQQVYPDWVARGKLSEKTAAHRIAAIELAIDLIFASKLVEPMQPSLFDGEVSA